MVTVLLPTYNAEKYIAQCIKSILHQTYRDFELLIIDSASDDNTVKIIKSFEDPRINLHQIERCPLGRSLNYGLKNAKFDLIARMDADDLMVPERLEVQLAYLKEHPEVDVLSCNSAYFMNDRIIFLLKLPESDENIKRSFMLHNVINHPGAVFKRSLIISSGGFSEEFIICQDYEIWLRLRNKAKFHNLQEFLIFMQYNPVSLSRERITETNREVRELHKREFLNAGGFNNSSDNNHVLAGWREYFYGNKVLARKYWRTPFRSLTVFPAYCFTYLPEGFNQRIKEFRLRMRIEYLLSYYSKDMRSLRRVFRNLIHSGVSDH